MRNEILIGDVRETLLAVPDECVHCVVTSPPYWALRDYEHAAQLGSEDSPTEFIAAQIAIFDQVRRVLRKDGVLWVNIGDTYSQKGKHGGKSGCKNEYTNTPRATKARGDDVPSGCRHMIPERFAIAMIDAGWLLRQVVIWHKPAPMPESLSGWKWVRCRVKVKSRWDESNPHPSKTAAGVAYNRRAYNATWKPCEGCKKCDKHNGYVLRRGTWRPTTSHEVIYQFTKSKKYFGDEMAAAEPTSGTTHNRGRGTHAKAKAKSETKSRMNDSFSGSVSALVATRNPRSVWTMSAEPYRGEHFAAFPTELPRRCITASTSARGCCPNCGSQWAPIVESTRFSTRPGTDSKVVSGDGTHRSEDVIGNRDPLRHETSKRVLGYRATCRCPAHEPVPCVVFDPYAGSGTTLQVANQLGRDWIGCELNPKYVKLIRERIGMPLPRRDGKPTRKIRRHAAQKELFST